MKILDINTAIGHWPFRQIPNQTPAALRRLLESKGISGAAVANSHGIFYKNTHNANYELFEAIAGHNDFFTGVATLNPTYPAWERDLEQCVNEFKFRALRLFPLYHKYSMKSTEASSIITLAGKLKIPVIVPVCVVNFRQMHWMDIPRQLDFDELKETILKHPGTNFIVTESTIPTNLLADNSGSPLYPNLYLEMSRYRSALGGVLTNLIKTIGADHVIFGSGAPFKEITPALLKLENTEVTAAEKSMVSSGNFKRLLKI